MQLLLYQCQCQGLVSPLTSILHLLMYWLSTFWKNHDISGLAFNFQILYLPTYMYCKTCASIICTIKLMPRSWTFQNSIQDDAKSPLDISNNSFPDFWHCTSHHYIYEAAGAYPPSSLQITTAHFQMLFEASCMLSSHWTQTIHRYLQISNRETTSRSRLVSLMLIIVTSFAPKHPYSATLLKLLPYSFLQLTFTALHLLSFVSPNDDPSLKDFLTKVRISPLCHGILVCVWFYKSSSGTIFVVAVVIQVNMTLHIT